MLHHDVPEDLNWAGSAFKGQVVFPKIFESQVLQEYGYLELFCIPGLLAMSRDYHKSFKLIQCEETTFLAGDDKVEALPVTQSLNMFPSDRLLWHVFTLDDSVLIHMSSSRKAHNQKISPRGVLLHSSSALFSESCPHPHDTLAQRSVTGCWYVLPGSDIPRPSSRGMLETRTVDDRNGKVIGLRIIPTKDNERLRFIALSTFEA